MISLNLDGELIFTMKLEETFDNGMKDHSTYVHKFNITDINPDSIIFDQPHNEIPSAKGECYGGASCGKFNGDLYKFISIPICDSAHAERLRNALKHLYDLSPKAKPPAF